MSDTEAAKALRWEATRRRCFAHLAQNYRHVRTAWRVHVLYDRVMQEAE